MDRKFQFWIVLTLAVVVAQNAISQDANPSAPTSWASATPGRLAAESSGVATNDYKLPEAGTLHLVVPTDWKGSFKKTIVEGTRADEIQFVPTTGNQNDFVAMVIAVHMTHANAELFKTREVLAVAVQRQLAGSAERTQEIQELNGPEAKGHYVSLTDAGVSQDAPKPGEYKYLTMGYAKLGDLVLTLRLVSNRNGDEKAQALEMIRTARLTAAQ